MVRAVTGRAELPHGRVLLGGIVALALAVHLVGIRKDLPYAPEIDEPLVVNAAVRIGALIDTDPGWFGHPASTLIYSLAGVYRLWSVVAYHGPLVGRDPRLMSRFLADSGEFYLLGRLLNVAFALAALPLLWAVGRRAFDDAAGLVAAWFVILSPLAVEHAQMVRSDTSAAFFGLLALWLCLRCHEQPSARRHVVAGLAIGLAVASRYFMVLLVAPFAFLSAAAWWGSEHRRSGWALGALALGMAAIPIGFLLAVPGFLANLPTVADNLRHEAKTSHLGADGLSPAGNLLWYLHEAIPDALSWPVALLAVAGVLLVLRDRQPKPLSLLVLVVAFLGGISLSSLHWERWLIPVLPVLALLAALSLVRLLRALGPGLRGRRLVRVVAVSLGVLVVSTPAVARIVRSSLQQLEPSTRVRAREWALQHLPPGSTIAEEWYTAPLGPVPGKGIRVSQLRSLAEGHTLEDYARERYDVLIVSTGMYGRYLAEPARYPAEVAFYSRLFREGQLLQAFAPSATSRGPMIRIYRIAPAPATTVPP